MDQQVDESILGTSYVLAILKYARTPFAHPRVQAGTRFLLESKGKHWWRAPRHPVHTILGLTEWPDATTGSGIAGARLSREVQATLLEALGLLGRQRERGGWPATVGGHRCIAWTANVVYALGRLRERGVGGEVGKKTLALLRPAVDLLLAQQLDDDGRGQAWPRCGEVVVGDVPNTALAVIALSHRHVESAARDPDEQERWGIAYRAGRDWLLANHTLWEKAEYGEHDAEAADGWRHVVWSLAPRACLSAGTPPQHDRLYTAMRFAFDRWTARPIAGWAIQGDGVTAYADWSVVQLGQATKLAISRQDPLVVLHALYRGSVAGPDAAGVPQLTLNPFERTARVVTPQGTRILELAGQNKRWAFILAFADRALPPGSSLDAEALYLALNPRATRFDEKNWNALRGLVHELNSSVRKAFGEGAPRLFQSSGRGDRTITVLALCSVVRLENELASTADPTGISESTGEAY
jgi:hypothetical protein